MLTWGAFLYGVLRKVLHLTILFLGRQMTHGAPVSLQVCLPQCGCGVVCRWGRTFSKWPRCPATAPSILFHYVRSFARAGPRCSGSLGHIWNHSVSNPSHSVHGKLCQK